MPYITLSRVITATMLFLLFVLYSSLFVGTTLNYEILGAALELRQLKIEYFSPGILKCKTKHEKNPFTLNCSTILCTFLFIFHAGSRGMGSKNIRNSSYKANTAGSARVSRLSFLFLWLCPKGTWYSELTQPRPQSNLKKIALAPHDFAGNFYLIWFVNCKTLKLIYAMPRIFHDGWFEP